MRDSWEVEMALSPIGGSFGNLSSLGASGAVQAIGGVGFDPSSPSDVMNLAGRAIGLCQNLPPQFVNAIDSYVQSFQAISNPDKIDIQAAGSKLNAVLQTLARLNQQIELRKIENLNVDPTTYLEDGQNDPFESLGAGYSGVPDPSQIQVDSGFDMGVQGAYQSIVSQLGNLGVDSVVSANNTVSVEASLASMINNSLFGS